MKINLTAKKYFRIYILFFVLMFLHSILLAQPVNNLVKDVVMPAPNAAALGKYGEIPVSYFTGVPDISIPIYTVQSGSLSIPVSLSYHASGIKVAEIASWVGMGWSLNAGGIITRTVQGIPDERPMGYYMNGNNITLPTTPISTQIIKDAALGQNDGEPDIFNFNVGGYSGKFYFDKDKKAQFIPKQDFIMGVTKSDNDFLSFILTVADGTRYTFGQVGTTTATEVSHIFTSAPYSTSSDSYISSWYLLKIETPDLAYAINLTYEEDNYSYKNNSSCRKVIQFCTDNNGTTSVSEQNTCSTPTTNGLIVNSITGKRIKTIQTLTETITFNAITEREDLDNAIASVSGATSKKRLDNIVISTGSGINTKITTWNLNYDYFLDNMVITPTSKDKRLRLLSVYETDGTTAKPPYTFEYNGSFIVNRFSKAIDHWGFYNAQIGNDALEFNYPQTTVVGFQRGSANRESNETAMEMGVLTKITYPTGGFTQFDFEGNRVPVSNTVPTQLLYMESCSPLPLPGTISTLCCGSHTNGTILPFTATQLSNIVKFTLTLDAADLDESDPACSGLSQVTIKVYNAQKDTLFGQQGFNINRAHKTYYSVTYPISNIYTNFQPNTNYYFELIGTNGNGSFSMEVTIPNTIDRIVGGLRVKSVTSNDNVSVSNNIVKTYEYLEPEVNASSGVLIQEPIYGYLVNAHSFNGSVAVTTSTVTFESQSIVPLGGFGGYHIGYHHVRELFNGIGSKSHYYYYTVPLANNNVFPLPPPQFQKELGQKVLEETFKVGSTIPVASKEFTSTPANYTFSPGSIFKVFSIPIICQGGNIPTFPQVIYTPYNIETDVFRLAKTTEKLDGVETITNYTYSTDQTQPLFPISISVKNSDEKTTVTTNKYITHPDFNTINVTPPGIYCLARDMKFLNLISTPIETTTTVGGVQTNGTKTEFGFFDKTSGNNLATTSIGSYNANTSLGYMTYPHKFHKYKMTWNQSGTVQVYNNSGGWEEEGTITKYDPLKGKPEKINLRGWENVTETDATEKYTWDAMTGLIKSKKFKDYLWLYDYHPNTRLVSKITNIDGQYTEYFYDDFQRLKQTKARLGAVVTDYIYKYQDVAQNNKNWIETKTTFSLAIGGALSNNTTYKTLRQYMDGLGRPIQSVAVANSPNLKDVISVMTYDNQGREYLKYDPFESVNNTGAYVTTIPANQHYTETKYEASPLSRVTEVKPKDWQPTTTTYGANGSNEAYNMQGTGYYPPNELMKVEVKDPDGRKSVSYTDKKGRKVFTTQYQVNTSNAQISPTSYMIYEYDDKDRLKKVQQQRNIYEETVASNADLDFWYVYDWDDNITKKKVPGADYVDMFYNVKNQLVYTQDGNQRALGRYLATSYTDYGLVGASGFTTNTTLNSFNNPQIPTVSLLASTEYGVTGTAIGKPTSSFNKYGTNLETVYEYDSYGRLSTTYSNNHLYTPNGLISLNNNSEKTIITYDLADNVLTKVRTHKPNASTTRTITETMDYDNGLRLKRTKHKVDNEPEQILSLIDYTIKDQVQTKRMGQPASGGNYLQKVDFGYNALGWLTSINNPSGLNGGQTTFANCSTYPIANTTSTTDLDVNDLFMLFLNYNNPSVGYAPAGTNATPQYGGNIAQMQWQVRGRERQAYTFQYDHLNRMTEANYAEINSAGAKVNDVNKYQEKLTYDVRGNIKSLQRKGLLNISGCQFGTIDNLTYLYNDSDAQSVDFAPTNRLRKVNELADITKGFKRTGTGGDYTYDANGNLKTDPNKGITNILYNHLNLPERITFSSGGIIEWLYDAGGNKLRKCVTTTPSVLPLTGAISGNHTHLGWIQATGSVANNATTSIKSKLGIELLPNFVSETGSNSTIETDPNLAGEKYDYLEGIEYKNGAFDAIYHAEGRVITYSNVLKYEYALKDHLGNTRLMFMDKDGGGFITQSLTQSLNEVTQENHYYPFGLNMEGTWSNTDGIENKYQYNGKELNSDFGLEWMDYGKRWYDAIIGRFPSVDPIIDQFPYLTPYNYASNNPSTNIDLWGLQGIGVGLLWKSLGITTATERQTVDKVNEYKASEDTKNRVGLGLNGLKNTTLGVVSTIGAIAAAEATGGYSATGLPFTLGEIGIGLAQMSDAISGNNPDKNSPLHEVGTPLALSAKISGVENANVIDAATQLIPGFLSGGNIQGGIDAIKQGYTALKQGKVGEAVFQTLSATDAYLDVKGGVQAVNAIVNPANKAQSNKPIETNLKPLTNKEVNDIKKWIFNK